MEITWGQCLCVPKESGGLLLHLPGAFAIVGAFSCWLGPPRHNLKKHGSYSLGEEGVCWCRSKAEADPVLQSEWLTECLAALVWTLKMPGRAWHHLGIVCNLSMPDICREHCAYHLCLVCRCLWALFLTETLFSGFRDQWTMPGRCEWIGVRGTLLVLAWFLCRGRFIKIHLALWSWISG